MKIINNIKTYFIRRKINKTYRIVEINDLFIPQVYSSDWEGIDRGEDPNSIYANLTWSSKSVQEENCGWKTYEEANERLLKFIDFNAKSTPKIHCITLEPEAWRILKKK